MGGKTGKSFTASYHGMNHVRGKHHPCNECAESFSAPGDLRHHMKEKHHPCDECAKSFSTPDADSTAADPGIVEINDDKEVSEFLKEGLDLEPDTADFESLDGLDCQLCEKHSNGHKGLERHQTTAGFESLIGLDYSDKEDVVNSFEADLKKESNIRKHLTKHTREGSKNCKIYNKVFKNRSSLRTHLTSKGSQNFEN